MRRPLLPLVLALVVVLGSAAPVLAQGDRVPPTAEDRQESQGRGSDDTPPAPDSGEEDAREEDVDDDASDDRARNSEGDRRPEHADDDDRSGGDRGRDRERGPPAAVGTFTVAAVDKRATGDYVQFGYNDTGVQNFSADGVTLFNMTVDPETEADGVGATVLARGPQLRLRSPFFSFTAHDNPNAVSRFESERGVQLSFVQDATLVRLDDERVQFSVGKLTGMLRGEGLRVNGTDLYAEEDLLVFLDTPKGRFDQHRPVIGEAIAKGHVGAEATFNFNNGSLQEEVVSYGNVTMTTVRAEQGNLTVLVEGHGFEGRVLVLNVDGRLLGASQSDQLNILLDNLTIHRADGLLDILDPDDDGYQPEYYIVHDPLTDPDAFQLIVTVPHYSVHTLSATTAFVLPPPSVVIGIVAGVMLLAPAALLLFRRK